MDQDTKMFSLHEKKPNLSMHRLLEHINQVIKSKDNDSTVNKTEYGSKRKVDVCENGGLWSKYIF